MIRFNK